MPLETATYISDLVATNPAASDPMSNADDHMRLIKAVLKNTFPGLTGAFLTSAGGVLIPVDGTASAPGLAYASEPTLGLRRSAAGVITITGGQLRGRGAVPVGSIHMFPKAPAGLGMASGAGFDWIECNGATYNVSDYPDLAAFLGVATGTFAVPNLTGTGRFLRSRRSGIAEGTSEANLVGSHTHTGVTDAQGNHQHTFSGATGSMNRNNPHSHNYAVGVNTPVLQPGGYSVTTAQSTTATSTTDINHEHAFSGTTDAGGNHQHNLAINAAGGAETRPEAYSVVMCIKT